MRIEFRIKPKLLLRAFLPVVLAMLALAVCVLPVMAAIYSYYATLTVQETGGSTYTMLPIMRTVNNTYLADHGYIDSSGLNTAILSGATGLPHMLTTDNVVFASAIDLNSTSNFRYCVNYLPAMSSFYTIVGYGGYVTISNNASLELGNNFEVEQSGYVDTSGGSNKDLVYKPNAFRTYVSALESIKSSIMGAGSAANVTLVPNAAGDYTNIASVSGNATHWEAVDDPPASPDDATSYVYNDNQTQQKDAYNLEDWSVPVGDTFQINSVTVFFRISSPSGAGYGVKGQPFLRLGSAETTGTEETMESSTYITYNETLTRPGGGTWSIDDINSLQVVIGLRRSGAASYDARCTQIYAQVDYNATVESLSVTATSVASGDHTVRTTSNATSFAIYVDGSCADNTTGASVPDNSNAWVLMQNDVMPYMEYYKHTVNGTLMAWYQPITMISGTTLPDRQGVAQDGIITWGSNPAGISANITHLISMTQPALAPSVSLGTPDVGGVTSGVVPGANTTSGNVTAIPLFGFVDWVADIGDVPYYVFLVSALTMLTVSFMTLSWRAMPHLFITGMIGLLGMTAAYAMGIYEWWMLVIYGIIMAFILAMERVTSL